MGGRDQALLEILPAGAAGAELLEEEGGEPAGELYPEERAAIADASEGRRREFLGGRICAHRALELLGVSPVAVPVGADGAPVWPDGIVGSIAHKGRYRAAAVAFASDLAGLGIDAELDAPLPAGVLERIASPSEVDAVQRLLADRPGIAWDRLLFSAKEAGVKAYQGLGLGITGVKTAEVQLDAGGTTVTAFPADGLTVTGAWVARLGLLVTAAELKLG